MNRLVSFTSALVLLTAHSVCTILIAVFSRKLYADDGNDSRGFFTVKVPCDQNPMQTQRLLRLAFSLDNFS